MDLHLPAGCGNAPRVGIVADVVAAWASNDGAALGAALDPEATWSVAGCDAAARAGLATVLSEIIPAEAAPGEAAQLDFSDIITHGRLASCLGTLTLSSGVALEFSHHVRFRSTGKTAPVVSVRTFLHSVGAP